MPTSRETESNGSQTKRQNTSNAIFLRTERIQLSYKEQTRRTYVRRLFNLIPGTGQIPDLHLSDLDLSAGKYIVYDLAHVTGMKTL